MRHLPPTARTGLLLGLALAVTLWASVGAAFASEDTEVHLAGWPLADYAGEPVRFKPLSFELVREVYGDESIKTPVLEPTLAPLVPSPSPTPAPSTPPPTTDPSPTPSPTVEPTPGQPALAVSMRSNRSDAAQGETITYTVTLTNHGDSRADDVLIRAAVPQGARLVDGDPCEGNTVGVTPDPGVCIAPTGSDPREVSYNVGTLNAGATVTWSFTVRVNLDTPDGTRLRTRARVSSSNATVVQSDEVVVVVV